jgi:hypothetical protein
MTAVKSVSIVALLAAAGLWPHGMPYEVVVRFVVAAGALLAVLALLYDPVVPVFSFSGDWQRGLVVASALPFVVSFRLAQFEDRTQ